MLAVLPGTVQASTSTAPNPTVVFDAPGDQAVTLEVCNAAGCDSITQIVRVLDPNPRITSAALGLSTVEAGQQVSMSGTATGRPPLLFTWTIRTLGGLEVTTLTGSSGSLDTAGLAPGDYMASLTVTNIHNSDTSSALSLTIRAPPPQAFHTVTPCRLLDTRGGLRVVTGSQLLIAAAGSCGIAFGARAVAANVTVVDATEAGYVSVFPGDGVFRSTSTVSFGAHQTRASFAVLPLAFDGSGTLAAVAGLQAGSLHLIIDVTGYFLPTP